MKNILILKKIKKIFSFSWLVFFSFVFLFLTLYLLSRADVAEAGLKKNFWGKKIQFSYSDSQSRESLLIRSNKKEYGGFTNSWVHFSITNQSGHTDLVGLQFYFPSLGTANKLEVWSEGKNGGDWQEIKLTSQSLKIKEGWLKRVFRQFFLNKKIPSKFILKKTTGENYLNFSSQETKYFRLLINSPLDSQGEFYIEAKGIKGSYGLLDPWWNFHWFYKRPITINNSASALTNYQVAFTFDSHSLINQHKMRKDCADIRITDDKTSPEELPFWLEDGTCNTEETRVWVKLNNIPVGTTTIYMYYGNPYASSASNGEEVFPFFDDFNSYPLDASYCFEGGKKWVSEYQSVAYGFCGNSEDCWCLSWVESGWLSGVTLWAGFKILTTADWWAGTREEGKECGPILYSTKKFSDLNLPNNFEVVTKLKDYWSYENEKNQGGIMFYQDRDNAELWGRFRGEINGSSIDGLAYAHISADTADYDATISSITELPLWLKLRKRGTLISAFYSVVNDDPLSDDWHSAGVSRPLGSSLNRFGLFARDWNEDYHNSGYLFDYFYVRKFNDKEPTTNLGEESPRISGAVPWWNHNWHYKMPITIENSGSDLTNFQISFTFNSQDLIFAHKMRQDCGDIRVIDAGESENDQLHYWIEPGTCNTSATTVWTKLDIPAGTRTIYMYYGNPYALSTEDGDSVFEFFDDFSGSTLKSDWTENSPSGTDISLDSGKLKIKIEATDYERMPFVYYNLGGLDDNYEFRVKLENYPIVPHWNTYKGLLLKDNNNQELWGRYKGPSVDQDGLAYRYIEGGSDNEAAFEEQTTLPAWFKIRKQNDEVEVFYSLDSYQWTKAGESRTIVYSPSAVGLFVKNWGTPYFPATALFDNFYLYKYSSDLDISAAGEITPEITPADINPQWWNSNWLYRKKIGITNSGDDQSDYTLHFLLNTADLISSNKMQEDCDDIRLVDQSGETAEELNYWIENCNTDHTHIWVKIPSLPSGNKDIYLYYGNFLALSSVNPENTFKFFDDFSGDSLKSEWITDTPFGKISLYDSKLEIEINRGEDADWWGGGTEEAPIIYYPLGDFTDNYEVMVKLENQGVRERTHRGIMLYLNRDNAELWGRYHWSSEDGLKYEYIEYNVGYHKNFSGITDFPLWLKIRKTGNQTQAFYSLDGYNWVLVDSRSLAYSPSSVGLFAKNWGGVLNQVNALFDNFALYPYNSSINVNLPSPEDEEVFSGFAWWSVDWAYKRPISVIYSGGTFQESDIWVKFTLNTKDLISNQKMKNDCGDLRVVEETHNDFETVESEIEDCNTEATKIWFKVPKENDGYSIKNQRTFYLYYGNPDASATSSSHETELTDYQAVVGLEDVLSLSGIIGWGWSDYLGWLQLDASNAQGRAGVWVNYKFNPPRVFGWLWSGWPGGGWICVGESCNPQLYGYPPPGPSFIRATLNTETKRVWGWAKFINWGDEGWICLSHSDLDSRWGTKFYGVKINDFIGIGTLGNDPPELKSNWSWNQKIGWIMWKPASCDYGEWQNDRCGGQCGPSGELVCSNNQLCQTRTAAYPWCPDQGRCLSDLPDEEADMCSDSFDNDCDGCTDSRDSGCGGREDIGDPYISCQDTKDNDCDGKIDCQDEDCYDPAICCTEWEDDHCGANGCAGTEMYQTRTCQTPSDVFETKRCIEDVDCLEHCTCTDWSSITCGGTHDGLTCEDDEVYQTRDCTKHCALEARCIKLLEDCSNDFDDDCDGCKDGIDSDCGGRETSCSGGSDDDCDGKIDCYDEDCATDLACRVAKPTNLSADGSQCGQITLTWSASTDATAGYNLYRSLTSDGCTSLSSSTCQKIASLLSSTTSYTDKQVIPRVKYYYWVTALKGMGEDPPLESLPSDPANGETVCFPPTEWEEK